MIKQITFSLLFVVMVLTANAQTVCDPNGNLIIISNYDGGFLNFDIDQNVPNIKIGIVSYESARINIGGPFAGNVSEVVVATYGGINQHCGVTIDSPTVNVPVAAVTILYAPPANYQNSNGHTEIICNYSCTITSSQGGCNTPDQLAAFFLDIFPGSSLYAHHTQYNCWDESLSMLWSEAGNCCALPSSLASTSKMDVELIQTNSEIIVKSFLSQDLNCILINSMGQVVSSQLVNQFEKGHMPISGLASGIYLLTCQTAMGKQKVYKLVI